MFTVGGKPQQRSEEPHAHVYIRAPYGVFAHERRLPRARVRRPRAARSSSSASPPSRAGRPRSTDGPSATSCLAGARRSCWSEPTEHWLERWAGPGCGSDRSTGTKSSSTDPQIIHNGTFVEYDHPTEGHVKTPGFPYRFSRTPPRVERGAPLVGEHTREVLAEAGYAPADIDDLIASGAAAAPAAIGVAKRATKGCCWRSRARWRSSPSTDPRSSTRSRRRCRPPGRGDRGAQRRRCRPCRDPDRCGGARLLRGLRHPHARQVRDPVGLSQPHRLLRRDPRHAASP